MKTETKNKKFKTSGIVWGTIIGLLIILTFNFLGGIDYIKANLYTPSGEMQTIIDELGLTGKGVRTLKATSPKLSTREIFNEKCNSHDSKTYVLGCYIISDDNIYLYDIESSDLDGVKESTTAHELLHAIYRRLPFWEKDSLNKELKKAYDALEKDNDIRATMELYNESDFYDELHSRLGTEIKNLPESLEKHYATIFTNQDKIVDFYEKYSSKFKKLEKELKELGTKIEESKKYIDNETARLDKLADELNKKIEDYNKRIEAGNYSSVSAAKNEGNALQNEINSVNKSYDDLNKYIDEYNKMIDNYNSNVIQTNKILDSINSNSEGIESINN